MLNVIEKFAILFFRKATKEWVIMQQLIIENNNPNQLANIIVLLVIVFVFTNIVRIIFDLKKKKRLEKLLKKCKGAAGKEK